MIPPDATVVMARYGDVGVKSSQVRRRMERQLRSNIEALLDDRGIEGTVTAKSARVWIDTDRASLEAATAAASDAFGVVSASPARRMPAAMDAILDALRETAEAQYSAGSFAIRARRAGPPESHPFRSADIERRGGTAVWETVEDEFEPTVDLDRPDVEFFVECRKDSAYVFLEKRPGPGGLPLGSQAPLVALISGGIDSPVSAWLSMKRGSPIIPVYFDFGKFGGQDHVARATAAIGMMGEYAPNFDCRPRIVPAGPAAERLVEAVGNTRMLSLRRFMLRVASRVAADTNAVGVVVGESLGQKSSQTATNMATTDPAIDLPVHRPLLGYDKQEIIDMAREIGTYEEATIPAGCNRIAPTHPATAASLDRVADAEPDLEPLVTAATDGIEIVDP